MTKKTILAALAAAMIAPAVMQARSYDLNWDVSLYGTGATARSLPFWAVANKNGIVPDTHSGFFTAGSDFRYGSDTGLELFSGVRFSGSLVPDALTGVVSAPAIKGYETSSAPGRPVWRGMVDEVYAGIGWKMLRLDVGMIDRETSFNGLSLTGGDIIWSGNARNMPGYNFQVKFFEIPGTRGIFSVRANYADYKLVDDRYIDGALLHNKSLFFRFRLHRRVDFIVGLEHWAMWGGVSPQYGQQPQSFKDYLRIVCGRSGGDDATLSDQINVLGNHLGRELIQVDWRADAFTMTFIHDIPFEDGSGMRFQNFPDGANTISFSFNDKDRWVTDILYEFVYTKWQSGPRHDRPATDEELEENPDRTRVTLGGMDNYFNNGEYQSGWTYFGRTVGIPLFTPMPVKEDGIVCGVCNNRVIAHHIGIGGRFFREIPYRFKATYSKNFGQYRQRLDLFDYAPEQVSLALEVDFPRIIKRLPLSLSVGLYGDVGDLYTDNFGLTLRLSYSGGKVWRTR